MRTFLWSNFNFQLAEVVNSASVGVSLVILSASKLRPLGCRMKARLLYRMSVPPALAASYSVVSGEMTLGFAVRTEP